MIATAWGSGNNPDMNEALAGWCLSKIQNPGADRGFRPPYTTMGVFDDRNLIGVCVFHDWRPESGVIEVSGASVSPRWMPIRIQMEACAYCFDQLKCQMMVMRVSEHNERLHRILRAYGFSETILPRMLGRDEDQFVFTLTDDDWRSGKFYRPAAGGVLS